MVIMMQVNYDNYFDSCQPEANSIYRMDMDFQGSMSAVISRPFARGFTESSPHVKAGMIMSSWNSELFYSVDQGGERQNFKDPVVNTTAGITRVFHFDMVEGNETALDQPETAIIPGMAHRLFGNESAIGKRLMGAGRKYVLRSAVSLRASPVTRLSGILFAGECPIKKITMSTATRVILFFRLDDPSNIEVVKENFKKNFDASAIRKDFKWKRHRADGNLP